MLQPVSIKKARREGATNPACFDVKAPGSFAVSCYRMGDLGLFEVFKLETIRCLNRNGGCFGLPLFPALYEVL